MELKIYFPFLFLVCQVYKLQNKQVVFLTRSFGMFQSSDSDNLLAFFCKTNYHCSSKLPSPVSLEIMAQFSVFSFQREGKIFIL